MDPFEFTANPARVIFGMNTIKRLPDELARLGLSRPLIISTPRQADQIESIRQLLQGHIVGLFDQAKMHTPIEITDLACEFARSTQADSLVSIGGGSTIGLGKAISFRTGIYHIAIPTTYAGSEVTPVLGETVAGKKKTRSDPQILPGTVIYDVNYTLSLPVMLSATSGINAIAHAVEALYAKNGNPITNLLAQEGIRALSSSLPKLISDQNSVSLRSTALYGAWLCGTCLGSVGMSLHHKLCHTLGGSFGLPHAETHTILLPHSIAYNAPEIPSALKMISESLSGGSEDPISDLNDLLDKLRVNRGLEALGMKETDIDRATELAVSQPYWNPREIEPKLIREVIRRAWAGEPARADL